MFSIAKAKEQSKNKKKEAYASQLKAGCYRATVINVVENENFVNNSAFIVHYEIFTLDGEFVQNYHETFLNNENNPRTQKLAKLLDRLNFQYVEELIGCNLDITVKYNPTERGYVFPTIVKHEPANLPIKEDASKE